MKETNKTGEAHYAAGVLMLAYGERSKCFVEGRMQDIVPFVGVVKSKRVRNVDQVGVGVLLPESFGSDNKRPKIFDTYSGQSNIIQAWRAMRVLESAKYMGEYTVMEAWEAVDHFEVLRLTPTADSQKMPDDDILNAIRVEIPPKLDRMLNIVRMKDININPGEIFREVRLGRLPRAGMVKDLLENRR